MIHIMVYHGWCAKSCGSGGHWLKTKQNMLNRQGTGFTLKPETPVQPPDPLSREAVASGAS